MGTMIVRFANSGLVEGRVGTKIAGFTNSGLVEGRSGWHEDRWVY